MSSKRDKHEICLKGRTDLQTAIGYLEDLVASLKAGTVCFENGQEKTLTLHPDRTVDFQIEADRRSSKESLAFELAWREPDPERDGFKLRISAIEPEAPSERRGQRSESES